MLSAWQKELMKYVTDGILWHVAKYVAMAKGGFPGYGDG